MNETGRNRVSNIKQQIYEQEQTNTTGRDDTFNNDGGGNDNEVKNSDTSTVTPTPQEKTEVESAKEIYKPYFDSEDKRLETEQKRAKRNKLFAGISDGISAIANLYAVSQGAPNQFTPQSALSGKAAERYDNLKKERNANKMAYNNLMYQARRTDKDFAIKKSANQLAALKAQLDSDKYNLDKTIKLADLEIKQAKEERDKEKHNLNMKLLSNKITQQQYNNKKAEIDARYAEAVKKTELAVKNAQIASNNANTEYKRKYTEILNSPETTTYEYDDNTLYGQPPKVKSKTTTRGNSNTSIPTWEPE